MAIVDFMIFVYVGRITSNFNNCQNGSYFILFYLYIFSKDKSTMDLQPNIFHMTYSDCAKFQAGIITTIFKARSHHLPAALVHLGLEPYFNVKTTIPRKCKARLTCWSLQTARCPKTSTGYWANKSSENSIEFNYTLLCSNFTLSIPQVILH